MRARMLTTFISLALAASAIPAFAQAPGGAAPAPVAGQSPKPVAGQVAPASPKAGGNATVTITFPSGYKTGPVPVPANKIQPVLYLTINGASVVIFIRDDLVRWEYAPPMAVSAIVGGYLGARVARRLPPRAVRFAVIVIAFGLSTYYFIRQYG